MMMMMMMMMMINGIGDVNSNYSRTSDSYRQAPLLEHLCQRHARPTLQIMMGMMMMMVMTCHDDDMMMTVLMMLLMRGRLDGWNTCAKGRQSLNCKL